MDATKLMTAGAALRELAEKYQAIVSVADVLAEVGSIQQARDEAVAQRETARVASAAAQAALEQIRMDGNLEAIGNDKMREVAAEDARTVLRDAYAAAVVIANEASERGQMLIENAKRGADALTSDAAVRLSEIQLAIASRQAQLTVETQAVGAARDELAAITQKIAVARAAIATALG